jgi:2-polyprenyl-3-methyl-5-hydroxy-6-metoxy-1,4-benzoquinol methylase
MNGKTQSALKQMDEKYWNEVAQDYDVEIFSALANDCDDVITSRIAQLGSKRLAACDFGCGVGKFLPMLAANFRHVYAVDISNVCLEQARDHCKDFENISYCKVDMSRNTTKLKKVHFGLSVNVVITPSEKKRAAILNAIPKHLYKGGHLVLVVPSLESALYADFRLVQWNRKAGLKGAEAVSELKKTGEKANSLMRQGIVDIDGVPTKHYLEEELLAMFEHMPFEVLTVEKVEYLWTTEFDRPPKWMKEPYPWDWMVVLKKIKN